MSKVAASVYTPTLFSTSLPTLTMRAELCRRQLHVPVSRRACLWSPGPWAVFWTHRRGYVSLGRDFEFQAWQEKDFRMGRNITEVTCLPFLLNVSFLLLEQIQHTQREQPGPAVQRLRGPGWVAPGPGRQRPARPAVASLAQEAAVLQRGHRPSVHPGGGGRRATPRRRAAGPPSGRWSAPYGEEGNAKPDCGRPAGAGPGAAPVHVCSLGERRERSSRDRRGVWAASGGGVLVSHHVCFPTRPARLRREGERKPSLVSERSACCRHPAFHGDIQEPTTPCRKQAVVGKATLPAVWSCFSFGTLTVRAFVSCYVDDPLIF